MKNPNSLFSKLKRHLKNRWEGEDFPNSPKRFQINLLSKDLFVFLILPLSFVAVYGLVTKQSKVHSKKSTVVRKESNSIESSHSSQIISFKKSYSGRKIGIPQGTLVKVRLQNSVETYSTVPVHAQIIGQALGANIRGETIIGEATPNSTYDRIFINFKILKTKSEVFPISARGLSLNGSFGLEAKKKEGFFARSALASAGLGLKEVNINQEGNLGLLLKILTGGAIGELDSSTAVEQNRSQVLVLPPGIEFFAELTDTFFRN